MWKDKAHCIVIITKWTTQHWYPVTDSHNQTSTKQTLTTTKQRESTPITQEFDPSSNINTVKIVNSNDILQAALRPSTILKYKTYQTKWKNYCMQNNI